MHLQLKNIGQITNADIRFGDLTVFVGPQATGKTIALEFLKLAVDLPAIQEHNESLRDRLVRAIARFL